MQGVCKGWWRIQEGDWVVVEVREAREASNQAGHGLVADLPLVVFRHDVAVKVVLCYCACHQ